MSSLTIFILWMWMSTCLASCMCLASSLGRLFPMLYWFQEETSQLQPFSFRNHSCTSLWIIVMSSLSVLSEKSVQGNPCLYSALVHPHVFFLCLLKNVLSNINHTFKQWWVLKCFRDQGYCPRVCMLPQTASFYKLRRLLPWDFTKLKAQCISFRTSDHCEHCDLSMD